MTSHVAWIVTDDTDLAARLGQVVQLQLAHEPRTSTVEQWTTGSTRTRAHWLFLDLRSSNPSSPQLWHDLAQTEQRYQEFPGTLSLCVAILDGVIPLEHAKTADRLLCATTVWPISADGMSRVLRDAEARARQVQRSGQIANRSIATTRGQFQTCTPSLFPMLERLTAAARHDFTILIVGETGTGKTTLARMLHDLSPRKDQKFLTVACGALPGDLIDSELFGHVKGAFTGADRTKEGKFEAASGGTILLDEIDVLALPQQAKLLRVLETGEYEPVGSNETKMTRCRTIVASNVCLQSLLETRQFRSDLYYRLNQVVFEIPPLRQRPMDLVPLAIDFIDECGREQGIAVQGVHPDLLPILRGYSWPGNIRELRNEVRRAVLFSRDGVVTPDAFSLPVLDQSRSTELEPALTPRSALAHDVATTERDSIEGMLRTLDFNRAATARALGISRVTLYNKIRKYGIPLDGG